MTQKHPYLQIYCESNHKFNKIIKHYISWKNDNIKWKNDYFKKLHTQLPTQSLTQSLTQLPTQSLTQLPTQSLTQTAGGEIELDNFIFEEFYDEELERLTIVIGKRYECINAFIDKLEPNIVIIEWFGFHQYCNIDKNLIHGEGTFRLMKTFIKYIKQHHKNIQFIKLADKAEFVCFNTKISLYKLYMLKYGKSFYEYKFGFNLDDSNESKIFDIHNRNIKNSEDIKIDKELIIDKLQKQLQIKYINCKYYLTQELIDEFVRNLINGELVRDFMIRYKIPDNQCEIFQDFMNIIFAYYNMDVSIVSLGAVYVKELKIPNNRKLTRKSINKNYIKSSAKLTKKSNMHLDT